MIQLDLTLYAGDTAPITAQFRSPDGVVVNLTGATIHWVMSPTQNSAIDARILSLTSEASDILVEDPANGVFTILIEPEDTIAVGEGIYYHEGKVTEADGTVTTIFSGTVTLVKGQQYNG